MIRTIRGKVCGTTIELDEDPGLLEGRRPRFKSACWPTQATSREKGCCAPREPWPTIPNGTPDDEQMYASRPQRSAVTLRKTVTSGPGRRRWRLFWPMGAPGFARYTGIQKRAR